MADLVSRRHRSRTASALLDCASRPDNENTRPTSRVVGSCNLQCAESVPPVPSRGSDAVLDRPRRSLCRTADARAEISLATGRHSRSGSLPVHLAASARAGLALRTEEETQVRMTLRTLRLDESTRVSRA